MTRVLGAIRLSGFSDESTSEARQEDIIEKVSATREWTVVGLARDIDVSATAVSPWKRPQLGEWLKPRTPFCTTEVCPHDPAAPCLHGWDIVLFWRLDRMVRNVGDFSELIKFCQVHEKNLVSCTEPIDLASPIGKAMAQIIAVFAELESSTTRLRILDGRKKLRALGRWGGGTPAYGYITIPLEGGGFVIDFDTDVVEFARDLVDRVLILESRNSIQDDFNKRGIVSPADRKRQRKGKPVRGEKWSVGGITKILTSPTIRGYLSHNGEVVRGDDGMPIVVGPALVTAAEWRMLQAILVDDRQKRRTRTPSPLLDVGFCDAPDCKDGKLYYWQVTKPQGLYRYFRCGNISKKACSSTAIRADDLLAIIEESFLHAVGHLEVLRKIYDPGEDHATELGDVEDAIAIATEELLDPENGPVVRDAIRAKLARLEARQTELAALPHRRPEWRTEATGQTYAEFWAAALWPRRRRLLVDSGVTLRAYRPKDSRALQVRLDLGMDLAERLRNAPPGEF